MHSDHDILRWDGVLKLLELTQWVRFAHSFMVYVLF
jgi:hypothetical protein